MMIRPRQAILLVEGDGDKLAAPELVRRLAAELHLHHLVPAPRPLKIGDSKRLRQSGNLEKWIRYGSMRLDGDCVLVIVDCDDDCPLTVMKELMPRASDVVQVTGKPVGFCLLKCEFKSLFLASLESIMEAFPDYGWRILDEGALERVEEIRGCKEKLSAVMARGRSYKETRDQVKFVTALDWERLRVRSRSFVHLERTLAWLANRDAQAARVYPGRDV